MWKFSREEGKPPMRKNLPQPGEVPLKAGATPVPPGVFLMDNFLKPRGLAVAMAAKRMQLPVAVLNDIVAQRRAVDDEIAARIATFTETSPRVWLNMQAAADRAAGKVG
jgi:addiction module HigA family antidote